MNTSCCSLQSDTQKPVALVTGASGGLGDAIARRLLREGWYVFAGSRSAQPLDANRAPDLRRYFLDVKSPTSVDKFLKTVLSEAGRIDLLVNCAGIGLVGPEEAVSVDQAANVFDTNVLGTLRMVQAVVPVMRTAGDGGIIVNIGSLAGCVGSGGLSVYSASKAAVERLTECMAAHYKLWNIRVLLVVPGPIDTAFLRNAEEATRFPIEGGPYGNYTSNFSSEFTEALKAGQDPDEVADCILRLLNADESGYRFATNRRGDEILSSIFHDPHGAVTVEEIQRKAFRRINKKDVAG